MSNIRMNLGKDLQFLVIPAKALSSEQQGLGRSFSYLRRALICLSIFLFAFTQKADAQCGTPMVFKNPTLVSGTALTQGAKYRFDNFLPSIPGAYAELTITTIPAGMSVLSVDEFTAASGGYDEAWQPVVSSTNASAGHVVWTWLFKANATTNTSQCFVISTLDNDGIDATNEEYTGGSDVASSYKYGSDVGFVNLSGGWKQVQSNITIAPFEVAGIDSTNRNSTYESIFSARNTFTWRTGLTGVSGPRTFSMYFEPLISFQPGVLTQASPALQCALNSFDPPAIAATLPSGLTNSPTYRYAWAYSTTASTYTQATASQWTVVPSTNISTGYDPLSISQTTHFVRLVAMTNSTIFRPSNVVSYYLQTNVTAAIEAGPYCRGQSYQLTATSTTPSVSYAWTGPNGFTSTLAAPTINSTTAASSGTYTVTASQAGGCSATATVAATFIACNEICGNYIDDDGDGFIDEADPDSPCFDPGKTLACDDKLYMVRADPLNSANTLIERLDILAGVPTLTTLFNKPIQLNALGQFNGFLYAMANGGNNLYRVDAYGNIVDLGVVANLPIPVTQWSAGTIDRDGNYYIMEGAASPNFRLYKIPLLPGSSYTATQITGTLNPQTPPAGNAINLPNNPTDIVIDENGVIYAFSQGGIAGGNTSVPLGGLYTININTLNNTATVTPVGVPSLGGASLGSLFVTDEGKLYGYGVVGDPLYQQKNFYSIDKTTGVVTQVGVGATSVGRSDGASCPWRVTLKRYPSTTCFYPGVVFNWEYALRNQSGQSWAGVELRDTLDPRFSYTFDVTAMTTALRAIYSNNVSIQLSSYNGGTNNVLTILGLILPNQISNSISLQTTISSTATFTAPSEVVLQQAWLKNLATTRGGNEPSDNPLTLGPFSDKTPVTVYITSNPTITTSTSSACLNNPISVTANNIPGVTYAWDYGAGASPATGTGIGPNSISYSTVGTKTVTLTVTSTSGCSATKTANVIVATGPSLTLGATPSVCKGTTAANLVYTSSFGSPNQYSINFDLTAEGQGFVDVTNVALGSSPIVLTVPSGAAAGTYNATVVVNNTTVGCFGTPQAIQIIVVAAPAITLSAIPSVCRGLTSTTLPYNALSAGASLYSINFDATAEAQGFVDVVNATITSSPIAIAVPATGLAGIYNAVLTVTNPTTGCVSTNRAITVQIIQAVTAIAGVDVTNCNGPMLTLAANAPAPGSGLWTRLSPFNGAVLSSSTLPNAVVTGLGAGQYVDIEWKITTGTCISRDTVRVSNYFANSPACNCNYIYSISGADANNYAGNQIRILNTTNGTYGAQVGANLGAAGVFGFGLDTVYKRFYYVDVATSEVRYLDPYGVDATTGVFLPGGASIGYNRAGYNPVDKKMYFISNDALTWVSYAPTVNGAGGTVTTITSLNYLPASAPLVDAGGDIVFDAEGNGYILTNSGQFYKVVFIGAVANIIYLGKLTLPTPRLASLAFGIDGKLYIGGAGDLNATSTGYLGADVFSINLQTLATTKLNGPLTSATVDFASCSFPFYNSIIEANKTYIKYGSAGSNIANGDTLEYTIKVKNTGNISAGYVRMLDLIPAGTVYVANTTTVNSAAVTDTLGGFRFAIPGGYLINGSAQAWRSGSIFAGDSATIKFKVKVSITCGTVTNTATIYNGLLNLVTQTNTLSVSASDPAVANAGVNQTNCSNGNFTLAATSAPSVATGFWTVVGGAAAANGAVVNSPTIGNSLVTGLNVGSSVTLRWTVSTACSSSFDDVVLTNGGSPTVVLGAGPSVCLGTTSANLTYSGATGSPDQYSIVFSAAAISAGFADVTNAALSGGTIGIAIPSGAAAAIYNATLTIRNSLTGCSSNQSISVTINPPPTANAGVPVSICSGGSVTIGTAAIAGHTYSWSPATGLSATNVAQPIANPTIATTYTVTVRNTATGCTNTSSVVVSMTPQPTITMGATPSVCRGTTAVNFPFSAVTGGPTLYSINFDFAAQGQSFVNVTDAVLNVGSGTIAIVVPSGAAAGTYNGTITVKNTAAGCPSVAQNIQITVIPRPTVNAGLDQTLCSTTFTVTGNTPTGTQTGVWTVVSGIATIASTATPSTSVTIPPGSSATLRWTVSNALCSASDDVVLNSTLANAGEDQKMCAPPSFIMTAVAPASGSGTWTLISGTASITTPTSATTSVIIPIGSIAILRWTVNTGTCSSFDDVILSNFQAFQANAGPDQVQCNTPIFTASGNSQAACAANAAVVNGSFETPFQAPNTYSLMDESVVSGWKTTAADNMIEFWGSPFLGVTSYQGNQHVELNANLTSALYQDLCVLPGDTINWSVAHRGRAGVDNMVIKIGIPGGLVTQKNVSTDNTAWVVYTGGYRVPAGQTVTRFQFEAVSTATGNNAIGNLIDDVKIDLVSRAPIPGVWSVVSGTAVITTPNSPTTTVTGVPAGTSVTLRWTSDNGVCSSFDDVVYTNNGLPTITLGANPSVCFGSTSANLPYTTTTFSPSQYSINFDAAAIGAGFVNVTNAALSGTPIVITVPAGAVVGTYNATLTVRNTVTGCVGNPQNITITILPISIANAGANTSVCNGSSVMIGTPTPAGLTYNYAWSPSTGLSATNIAQPIANPTVATTYTVTVTNALSGCVSTGSVVVSIASPPTITLGANPSVCRGVTAASIAYSAAVGNPNTYSIDFDDVVAEGQNFVDVSNLPLTGGTIPIVVPSNAAGSATPYNAVLTIKNAAGCTNSYPITVTVLPKPAANAGLAASICLGSSRTIGTTAVAGNTYAWSPSTGLSSTSIAQPVASPTATTTYTVTVTNASGCTATSSVVVTLRTAPSAPTVSDLSYCRGEIAPALTATGSGLLWYTAATGGVGSVFAPTPSTSTVGIQNYWVSQTVGCESTRSQITVTTKQTPSVSVPPNQIICTGANTTAVNFTGSAIAGTTYTWTNDNTSIGLAASGTGDIPAFTGINTVGPNAVATITVTPNANGCPGPAQTFTITVKGVPAVIPIPSQTLCNGFSTDPINLVSNVPGTTFTWTNSNPSIGIPANGNGSIPSFVAINNSGATVTATITVTPSGNGCGVPVPQTFFITVNPAPPPLPIGATNTLLFNFGSTTCSNFNAPMISIIGNPYSNTPLLANCNLNPPLSNIFSTFVSYNPKDNKIYVANISQAPNTRVWVLDVGVQTNITCPVVSGAPTYTYLNFQPNNFEFDANGDLWSLTGYNTTTGIATMSRFDEVTGAILTNTTIQFPLGTNAMAGNNIGSGDIAIIPNGRMFATMGDNPSKLYEITNYASGAGATATFIANMPKNTYGIAYVNGTIEITGTNFGTSCYHYRYDIATNTFSNVERPFQAGQSPIDNTSITPAIGVTKQLVDAKMVTSNSADLTYEVYVRNMGNVQLNSISVEDDIAAAYGAANVSNVTTSFVAGGNPANLTLNPAFNGTTVIELLNPNQKLINFSSITNNFFTKIQIKCRVSNLNPNTTYLNTAVGSGKVGNLNGDCGSSATIVSDLSNNGPETVVDPNNNANAGDNNENIPTPFKPFLLTTTKVDVNCAYLSTGSGTVTVSGGTAPFTYAWSTTPAQSTATATGLTVGTYTVTVTDATGVNATAQIVINALNPTPAVLVNATVTTMCSGNPTTVSATGGGTYSWSSGQTTNSFSVSPLVSTTYTVTVTGAGGCTASASQPVVVNTTPAITLGTILPICQKTTTAILPFSAMVGGANLYSIDFDITAENQNFNDVVDAPLTGSSILIPVPSGAAASTYLATITVRNSITGCVSLVQNIQIKIDGKVTATVTANPAQCLNGTFVLGGSLPTPATATGVWSVVSPASYSTTNISSLTLRTATASNVPVGTPVTLAWTVSNGTCSSSSTVVLKNDASVTANAGVDVTLCNATTYTLLPTTPSVGTGTWSVVSGSGAVSGGVLNFTQNLCSPVTQATGNLSRDIYTNIGGGTAIADLTNAAIYPNGATITDFIPQFSSNGYVGDNYGTRVRGYIRPTVTGAYTFIVTGDDAVDFYLSTDVNPANKVRLAYITAWTNTAEFTKFPTQTSVTVNLIAGQNYYTELFHKEGSGGDHFQVYWKTPSNATATIIPGANLVPFCTPQTTLRWTVKNGACIATDDVVITNSQPVIANAGPDQESCGTTFTMAATVPSQGTGVWTIISGPGVITTPTSISTTVTGVTLGSTTVLRWTVTNGACSSFDEVTLIDRPLTLNAGGNVTFCPGTFVQFFANLNANEPYNNPNGWQWSGPASFFSLIQNAARPNATAQMAGVYTVNYNSGRPGCPAVSTTVNLSMSNAARAYLTAKNTGEYCEGQTIMLDADTVNTTPNGVWTWTFPDGTIKTGKSVLIANATTAMNGNYTVKYSLTGCDFYSTTVVVVKANPTAVATNLGPYCYDATISLFGSGTDPSICTDVTNLVINGDFNDANAATRGFTSQYNYTQSAAFGNYFITNSPAVIWPSFASPCVDHTVGNNTGKMLIADGINVANSYIWQQNVTAVEPNKFYKFSVWVNNLYIITFARIRLGVNGQNLALKVNGVPTPGANVEMNYPVCQWVEVSGIWYSGNATTADLRIYDDETSGSGNDFALDDVAFRCNVLGNNAESWQWTGPNGFTSTLQNPVILNATTINSGTYTLVHPSVNGCTAAATTTLVIVKPDEPKSFAGVDKANCNNSTFTMTAIDPSIIVDPNAGAGSGQWRKISGPGTITSPNSYSTTVTGIPLDATSVFEWTVTRGTCIAKDTVTLRNDREVTSSAGSNQLQCNNATFNISTTGPSVGTGIWTLVSGSGTITNPNSISTTVTGVNLGSTTLVRWTVTNGACSATSDVSLTNSPVATASITGNAAICNGVSTTLTATGGGTYLWSNGLTTAAITVNPTANATYTVTVTNAGGCTATASQVVTVSPPLTATINGITAICIGSSTTLTAVGGGTYLWSTGAITPDITVSPTANTTYDVTVTNTSGCTALGSKTVTINPSATASISGISTICSGNSTTLTAVGGGTYKWSTGETTAAITVGPSVSATYSVTVTNGSGCTATASQVVTVTPLPTLTAISNKIFCAGDASAAINFTGTATINWTNSNPAIGLAASGTGNIGSFTATNTGTTVISSTITITPTANGCNGIPVTFTITVNPKPTVVITGTSTICNGGSTTLTASGGGTYAWSNGVNAAANPVSPTATTTYTVTVTDANGCTATASQTVTVNPIPTASISGASTICSGNSTTLTAAGGGTYLWSNGVNAAVNPVNPIATTTYTVTITNASGCTSTASQVVIVNPTPTPSISGTTTICNGIPTTLTATGGGTYSWSTGAIIANITVSPTANATYTVTVTNGSCSATASQAVTVIQPTSVNAYPNRIVCTGDILPAISFTGTGTSYTWVNNTPAIGLAASGTGNIAAFTTTNTGTTDLVATITVTPVANGCNGTPMTFTITVKPKPVVPATPNQVKCAGDASDVITLNTAGVTYNWTNSNTSIGLAASGSGTIPSFTTINAGTTPVVANINITPVLNGCTGPSVLMTITVNPKPVPSIAGNTTICNGGSTLLTASGGVSYAWSNTAITADINVSPTTSTTYTVTVTNASGCTATAIKTVVVNPLPTASISGISTLCNGLSGDITAAGGGTYLWSTGATSANITVNPTATTTYIVTVTNSNNCTSTASRTVTVNPTPTASIAGISTICSGTSTDLTVTGTGTYLWSTNETTATITVAPASTATYTVTVTNASNCRATASQVITVNPLPTASITGTATICNGSSTTLTAAGSGTYKWSTNETTAAITVSPTSNTTYTVTVTNSNNCTATASRAVTVDANVTANANADQAKCNIGAFTLAGNTPSVGSGLWTIVGVTNGATIAAPLTSATTSVSGLIAGTSVTLRWTVTNGTCSSSDDVVLTNNAPVTANAGVDQLKCNTSSFTMIATPAVSPASGLWTIVGAANGTVITTPTSATTGITGLTTGSSVVLRWTVSNGTCSSDNDVIMTNNADVIASAGAAQTKCNDSNFTLAANAPTLPATGAWSVVSPVGFAISNISNINSNTATVSNVAVNTSVTLRWTLSNGACSSSSTVVLTNNAPVTANANVDQAQCNNGSFTLAGNVPTSPATGLWTIVGAANGAAITTPTSATTSITGLTAGSTVTLKWTVSNGTCSTNDDVVLTNNAPVTANANVDQAKCNNGSFTLAGNVPTSPATGLWTIVGTNGATIAAPTTSATTSVSGLTAGTSVTLRWTVTNGTCSSSDDVVLTNNSSVTANAGVDQVKCNNDIFTLAGNVPTSPATGLWTIVGAANGTVITTPTSATTGITGLTVGSTVTLKWTVSNGTCSTNDDVILTNNAPVTANANVDQAKCNNGAFTLAGNTPSVGNGLWTIVGATNGATIASPLSSATTTVSGLAAGTSVTLRWTVTNGTCSSSDDVVLTNNALVTANAGVDQLKCNTSSFTMIATPAVSPASGLWTIVGAANGTVITTPTSATSGITGLTAGSSVVMRWTVTNGTCSSDDDVIMTNNTDVTANAGAAQAKCSSGSFTLAANAPTLPATGAWSVVSPVGFAISNISDINSNTATVSNVAANSSVTLRWTVSNGACSSSSTVVLRNLPYPKATIVAPVTAACTGTLMTFSAGNVAAGVTYAWNYGAGASVLTATGTNPATVSFSSCSSQNVRLVATLNGCTDTAYVLVNTNDTINPVFANRPANMTAECDNIPPMANITASDNCGIVLTDAFETSTMACDTATYYNGLNAPVVTSYWSAEGRIGDKGAATHEMDFNRPSNATNIGATAQSIWHNGIYKKFTYIYNPNAVGANRVTYVLDNDTTNLMLKMDPSNPASGAPFALDFNALRVTMSSSTATGTLAMDDVYLNGLKLNMPQPSVTGTSRNVLITGWKLTEGFVITGRVAMSWTGTQPTNSNLNYNITVGKTATPCVADDCKQQNYIISRTWTAEDACKNTVATTQIINVRDTKAPVFAIVPANITIECGAIPVEGKVTANDNCDATPTITYNGEVSSKTTNGTCTDRNYTITRTWTVVDNCGNSATASQVISIVAEPLVSISASSDAICASGSVSLTSVLDCKVGTNQTYQWQQSADATVWVNVASGGTSATYAASNLTQTTHFRLVVTQGACIATSAPLTISVVPTPSVLVASDNDVICQGGFANLTATVTGGVGFVTYQWQESPTGVAWTNIVSATNSTYQTPVLNTSRLYRVVVSQTGAGCDKTSLVQTVRVVNDPAITTQPQGFTECIGGTLQLNVTATGGYPILTYQWQESPDGLTKWTDIASATSSTYTPNSTVVSTNHYRLVVRAAGFDCATVYSNPVTVVIAPDPEVQVTVPSTTVCTDGRVILTANPTGGTGTCTVQWQSKLDTSNTWLDVPGATGNTYQTNTLKATSNYRAVMSCSGNGCCN
jgi:uncharacterized repeat protein (TIGR01451 family)